MGFWLVVVYFIILLLVIDLEFWFVLVCEILDIFLITVGFLL